MQFSIQKKANYLIFKAMPFDMVAYQNEWQIF